jgi:hypothetical protein
MQSVGANLTILYYSTEGISPSAARCMREAWGDIEVVFPGGFVHQRKFVNFNGIDDWYDDKISEAIQKLCAKKEFDVCVVNYAWYSKLFESLPPSVVRVIDSHDIFGNRAESFREIGLDPMWFHTSIAEEMVGLDRADFVIAIQDVEATVLRERTRSHVQSIGFLSPSDFLALRDRGAADRLAVGYVGSGNPFNVASMRAFGETVQLRPEVRAKLDIHVAGQVCNALATNPHPFKLRGIVDSVSDFYESVDVAVNPMLGGTGLKIKSIEALSFGKPLVATAAAMAGVPSEHPGHRLESVSHLLDYLIGLADEPNILTSEAAMSRQVFQSYQRSQAQAFLGLWNEIVAAVEARRSARTTRRGTLL